MVAVLAIVAAAAVGAGWYIWRGREAPPRAIPPIAKTAFQTPPPTTPTAEPNTIPAVGEGAPPVLPTVPKVVRIGGPSDEELYGGELAPGEVGADGRGGRYARETATFGQVEQRDQTGRITVEAAVVHAVTCPNGRRIQVYQFANRPEFRAVLPMEAGRALGGRDFPQYVQAVRAGCRA